MDIVKVFADNLRKYRTERGLSQEAFAEKCGLHRTYISAIERYQRSIALENIQRIADALAIETYQLFLPPSPPARPVFHLGTLEASEALLRDLYIDLRTRVNQWSRITNQTPQARMGYVGQHLVSVVTGFPGGKSGARGHDLEMGGSTYGEIKTCYRVDQLGACKSCGAVVSSLETVCSVCGSHEISRKDDSKWLISLRNDSDFERVIEPSRYYFVLFEFEELSNTENNNIVASIWEVDPKAKGFAFCMIDYYLNIRSRSVSGAPFDMWPHEFKFLLTKPKLIYRSTIRSDGTLHTTIFPSLNNAVYDPLKPLAEYARAKTLDEEALRRVICRYSTTGSNFGAGKAARLRFLENLRQTVPIPNADLCDALAEAVYLPRILPHKERIPDAIKQYYPELQ